MAPLSRELPQEHYGSHLDADGRTVDEELEKASFAAAGWSSARFGAVWSLMATHVVLSKYIAPDKSEMKHEELRIDTV